MEPASSKGQQEITAIAKINLAKDMEIHILRERVFELQKENTALKLAMTQSKMDNKKGLREVKKEFSDGRTVPSDTVPEAGKG